MKLNLTPDLAAALQASRDGELEVVDPQTLRSYHIVPTETHREAMEALRSRHDHDAIAAGLAQMDAGQGMDLAEAFALVRLELEGQHPQ
jgi:hypothetical protein